MVKKEDDYLIYTLVGNQKPVSWQLRHKDVLVDYESKGRMRKIIYVAGSSSILADQNEGMKPTPITFDGGQLRVPKSDSLLIKYLETHPEYTTKFKLLDPEADAAIKLALLELREEAKDKIRGADSEMLRAVAVMLFDKEAYHFGDRQIKLKCFDYADQKPQEMIDLLSDPKTQVRYLVVLAFMREILKTNVQKTAVLWEDNGEQIIPLAVGETAVEKMADFLYDDKNMSTLQELSKRVDKLKKRVAVS